MNTIDCDLLITNVHAATMQAQANDAYGIIKNAAVAIKDGIIMWIGPQKDLPANIFAKKNLDQAAWITPGLIDCHSHIVFAGNRSYEFEERLNGVSYEAIAKRGGGILSTVNATRAASFEALLAQSLKRVDVLLNEGVTTLEIKSGYGLNLDAERKMLQVARQIAKERPITVRTTFLGAHALPPEFKERADDYIDHLCQDILPVLVSENLVDAVDVFCENIGFSLEQTERMFQAAQQFNLPVKLHAEQLSDQHGAALAARYQALSADHLEYLSNESIAAMAKNGTVAVLLPGAFYYLRETKLPPIDLLRQANIPIALASDCNPGTSPILSLLTIMNMACTLFRLTPAEALHGFTRNAAQALGLQAQCGTLALGKRADIVLWDIENPAELAYMIGHKPCKKVIYDGKFLTDKYSKVAMIKD